MKTRQKAAGYHLIVSLMIAVIIGVVFKFLYFPGYYFTAFDGLHRFGLIIGVDVVLGPLLTLIVFNVTKPKKELVRDISLIAFVQVCALIYGLFVFTTTRPVYTVFDGKILTFISANEIPPAALADASAPYNVLPRGKPQDVYARQPSTEQEKKDVIFPIYSPPMYGPMTEEHRKEMYEKAEPLSQLNPALSAEQMADINRNLPDGISDVNQLRGVASGGAATKVPYFWAIITPQGKIVSVQTIPLSEVE